MNSDSHMQTLRDIMSDSGVDLLYYDRKESEALPLGAIENLVKSGKVSGPEIVAMFEGALKDSFAHMGLPWPGADPSAGRKF